MLSSAAYSSYLVPVLGGSTDTENAFDEEPDTNEIKNRNCVWLLWTFADWKIFSPKVLNTLLQEVIFCFLVIIESRNSDNISSAHILWMRLLKAQRVRKNTLKKKIKPWQ